MINIGSIIMAVIIFAILEPVRARLSIKYSIWKTERKARKRREKLGARNPYE